MERAERIYQLIAPDLPADFPPLKCLDSHPNNLPEQLTSFVGRDEEMLTQLGEQDFPYYQTQKRYFRKDETEIWVRVTVVGVRTPGSASPRLPAGGSCPPSASCSR